MVSSCQVRVVAYIVAYLNVKSIILWCRHSREGGNDGSYLCKNAVQAAQIRINAAPQNNSGLNNTITKYKKSASAIKLQIR